MCGWGGGVAVCFGLGECVILVFTSTNDFGGRCQPPTSSGTWGTVEIRDHVYFFIISFRSIILSKWVLQYDLYHYYALSGVCVYIVENQVCLLIKRPNPSNNGALQWSLRDKDICGNCVVVYRVSAYYCNCQAFPLLDVDVYGCPLAASSDLLFVDSLTADLLTRPENWNEETLDRLLNRTMRCRAGKYDIHVFVIQDKCHWQSSMTGTVCLRIWLAPSAKHNFSLSCLSLV